MAAVFLTLSTQNIAYQDALSLIAQEIVPGDRWQVRLIVGPSGPTAGKTDGTMAALAGPIVLRVGELVALPTKIDPATTGGIVRHASVYSDAINRAGKGDLLVERKRPRSVFNAGLVAKVALFAPAESKLPRTAFVRQSDMAVAAAAEAAKAATNEASAKSTKAAPPDKSGKESVALAYANPDDGETTEAPFSAVIAKPEKIVLDPEVKPTHAWVNNPIPKSAHSKTEMKCLAEAIYFEARGEPERGRIAVAQVVLNWLKVPAYPDTICSVVYQNKSKRHRCQFSFACDGIRDRIADRSAWAEAQALAKRVLDDDRTLYLSDVGPATHYHANYVKPRWARRMTKKEKIGRHIFYQTRKGGWS